MKTLAQKIKEGVKWQATCVAISQIMMFVVGLILARILSPKEFGIFALSEIIFNFIFTFWNMGLQTALVQMKYPTKKHFDVAFTFSILLGVICFFIGWGGVIPIANYFSEPKIIVIGRIISITFIIYSLDRVPTALLDRNLKFKEKSILGIINPITYGLVCIPLALSGYGPLSFAYGVVGRAVVITIAKILLCNKLFSWRPHFSIHKKELCDIISFGASVTLINVCTFLSSNLQRIIPGKILGTEAIGYLSRSANLSTLILRQANMTIASVLLPGFSRIQENKELIRKWLQKFIFFTYLLLAPPLAFFIFFPKETILGLFGLQWQQAVPLLPWLAGTALITAPNMYFETIFKAIGKPHIQLIVSFISLSILTLLLTIAANISLLAVAIALFISALCNLIISIIIFSHYQITSFKDLFSSTAEPLVISLFSAYCSSLFTIPTFSNVGSLQTLLLALSPHITIISLYLLYRYKHSCISYLDFDLKVTIKA